MNLFIFTDDTLLLRTFAGFVLALAVALVARRARALTTGGAAAAILIGTIAAFAGWAWVALLFAFFASSTFLSRWRRGEKDARTGRIVAKGDERDWVQVVANGAVFAGAALCYKFRMLEALGGVDPTPAWSAAWAAMSAGAIAAASADTWSTEIGALARGAPRLITNGREVPPGTSGGITLLGLAATLGGALLIGAVAWSARWPGAVVAAAVLGGIAGALADSFIGALAQARRRCPTCGTLTERDVHDCGTETEAAGGIAWLDNDAVNALCTGIGALAAFFFWRLLA